MHRCSHSEKGNSIRFVISQSKEFNPCYTKETMYYVTPSVEGGGGGGHLIYFRYGMCNP